MFTFCKHQTMVIIALLSATNTIRRAPILVLPNSTTRSSSLSLSSEISSTTWWSTLHWMPLRARLPLLVISLRSPASLVLATPPSPPRTLCLPPLPHLPPAHIPVTHTTMLMCPVPSSIARLRHPLTTSAIASTLVNVCSRRSNST